MGARHIGLILLGMVAPLAATPTLAGCGIARIAELPVTMAGLAPMVPAKINGADATFIADSGAFYSTISPGSAKQYGLQLTYLPNFRISGVGGDASASIATVKIFTLVGVPLPNIQFIVAGSEPGAAGLLGQNVLGIGDVEYDLGHSAIRLFRTHGCGNANLAYWHTGPGVSEIAIEPRSPIDPHTNGIILINGVKIRATFDTGAPTSILTLAAAGRAGVKPGGPGVTPSGATSGLGRHIAQSWIAPFESFKIGDEEIRNTRLQIGDIDLDGVDMLVGADFFLSHRIYVANGLHRMFLTYEGGPVFSIRPRRVMTDDGTPVTMAADATPEPTDAEGFSQRGEVFRSRRDYAAAIADLGRACAMKPTEPRYFYQRGEAYREKGEAALGRADLDRALALKPDYVDALLARTAMRLHERDRTGAIADLDAARQAAAPSADARLSIAISYGETDAFGAAADQFDLWIKAHPDDSRRPVALNGRCWVRAQSGQDLDKALADCTSAIHARPADASYLDSRGLVYLRLGHTDRAIADYSAALARNPQLAWSLYGRGVAERREGMAAQAATDITAATAIDAALPERFRSLGIDPGTRAAP